MTTTYNRPRPLSDDYNRPLPTDMPVEVPHNRINAAPDVVHSELYDDVRQYAALTLRERDLVEVMRGITADLAKVKSRLAQTVEAGGTRYLQAGNSGIVKITHVMGQGEKIALIAVEDIE